MSGVPSVVPAYSNATSSDNLSPELTKVLVAWPGLPPVVKAGILAMIDAAARADRDSEVNCAGQPSVSGI